MKRDNLSIEGLRCVLFLCIFLFHAWGQMFPLGWAGVNTFLVITAYFLTEKMLQMPRSEIHVRKAMWKRATRLYPVYMTVLVSMSALYFAGRHHLPADFFSYFLFAQNFQWEFVPKATVVPGCGHLWYLTLDFYLVLIWLFVLKYTPREWLKGTFITLWLFSLFYRSLCAYYAESITLSYTMPWGMMDMFAAGGLLATMTKERSKPYLPWIALMTGVACLLICLYTTAVRFSTNLFEALVYYHMPSAYDDSPITVQIQLVMALLSFFIVWICTCNRMHYGFLSNSYLAKWGGLTYELYIFHYPLIVLIKLFTDNHFIIILGGLIATIAVTLIWKRLVEQKAVAAFRS